MIPQIAIWLGVSILGGATAAIAGFGIGSILTPLLATKYSVTDAILAVSIPHAIATAVRAWRLRAAIEWNLLRGFGIASAAGGIIGALLLLRLESRAPTVLGVLLVATGLAGLTGWNTRTSPSTPLSILLGGLSGLFGGMAGNQGGLRAAALMTYRLSPSQFVATSTAVGLIVDAARLPVYITRGSAQIWDLAVPIGVATLGVLVGTLLGEKLLLGMSAARFRQVVSLLITVLGVWLLVR